MTITVFPRRNKAQYSVGASSRTRGEEDVAWPGSKWKLLKPLSPRANERTLRRLPGSDPATNARDPPPRINRSTRKIFVPQNLAPVPINSTCMSARQIALSRAITHISCVPIYVYFLLPLPNSFLMEKCLEIFGLPDPSLSKITEYLFPTDSFHYRSDTGNSRFYCR